MSKRNDERNMIKLRTRKGNIEVIDTALPIWITDWLEDRLDNNYYSPTYFDVIRLFHENEIKMIQLDKWVDKIMSGVQPSEGGDTPILEGRNLFPNVIMPSVEKYAIMEGREEKFLREFDILVIKDGSPGTVSCVLKPLLEFFEEKVTTGEHIFIVRLKKEHVEKGPFITAFLNSRLGQALIRRYITGAISPSINERAIRELPIPNPTDELVHKAYEELTKLQEWAIKLTHPVEVSERIIKELGLEDEVCAALPINWMPGGKRDAHGYYREQPCRLNRTS